MRRLGVLFATVALFACTAAPTAIRPAAGSAVQYVQTFRLSQRSSGGEELPNVRIERRMTVTCTAADADASTLSIVCGNVSVWLDEEDEEPDFVATDIGAATRAFDEEDSSLSRMYAALWATTAYLESQAVVDGNGVIVELVSGIEEIRRERGDDPSTDLGGSFLESLVDDPVLLLFGSASATEQPLRFRLDHWNASLQLNAVVTHPREHVFALEYQSDSGASGDGPFADLTLMISGDGARETATGMLESATLHMEVAAETPIGADGATRRDAAVLDYELVRSEP